MCYNGDIEGSRPKPATFATRRVVNPLAPQYSVRPKVPPVASAMPQVLILPLPPPLQLPRVPVRTEETPSLTVCLFGDICTVVFLPTAPHPAFCPLRVRTQVGRKAPLRDTMSTADIPGTAPTPYHKFATRDSHNVVRPLFSSAAPPDCSDFWLLSSMRLLQKDIDGAHPDWQPHHKSLLSGATRDIMSVADINGGRFKTKRVT